ncbi:MAG TPA: MotA/TolQ/ExbB proton channel family protein [Bryobacteraceae bacterium]
MNQSGSAALVFPSGAVFEAVRKASKKAAFGVHVEMQQGMGALATIAMAAPWVGMLGTVFGIVDSFVGCGGNKATCLAAVEERLSWSLWPTGVGLVVGLIALVFHRYLSGRLKKMDREMDSASLELINLLVLSRGRFTLAAESDGPVLDGPMFGQKAWADAKSDQKWLPWFRAITCLALASAWSLDVARNYADYSYSLASLALNACVWVLFTFGCSCLLAWPVWSKLMRRRPGGLAMLGSVICVCWNLAEFVW